MFNTTPSFIIEINEEQRKALLDLIKANPQVDENDNDNPLCYWTNMLDELPEVEAKHPKTIHGFCL